MHPSDDAFASSVPVRAAPLRRRPNFVRHEKKWMRKKRLKMEQRYLRLQEGVNELKAYIKFKQVSFPVLVFLECLHSVLCTYTLTLA